MICYYNLHQEAKLEESQKILKEYYPAKESELIQTLHTNSK